MHLTLRKTREQISRLRQGRIIAEWPIEKQMEAHAEAAQGRPEKLEALLSALDRIRSSYPYPEEA